MIGLLQRVVEANVRIRGEIQAEIGVGLLVLVGITPADTDESALKLLHRLLQYRIFNDEEGRMNRSLAEVDGALLLVPQFTLAADTHKGLRPGFSGAASPETARRLFEGLVDAAKAEYALVQSGVFGANMQVSLTNDGPVTFWLES
jgi:D-tyrosyl-tRNA(Tyr) deacylase